MQRRGSPGAGLRRAGLHRAGPGGSLQRGQRAKRQNPSGMQDAIWFSDDRGNRSMSNIKIIKTTYELCSAASVALHHLHHSHQGERLRRGVGTGPGAGTLGVGPRKGRGTRQVAWGGREGGLGSLQQLMG